eukprot:8042316-Ditylum_brightwellii.AAC.1
MNFPSEAFGTIKESQLFLLLIINVLPQATPMTRCSIKEVTHHLLPKVEVTIDSDINEEWTP